MKYLKKFENFDPSTLTGRVPSDDEQQEISNNCEKCGCDCNTGECTCLDCDCPACCASCCSSGEEDTTATYADYRRFGAKKPIERRPVLGDEVVEEKKKFNFEKKKGEKKEDKKDKKEDKKETKGLSASQKKLPAGLQKAILAKKK